MVSLGTWSSSVTLAGKQAQRDPPVPAHAISSVSMRVLEVDLGSPVLVSMSAEPGPGSFPPPGEVFI